LPIYSAIKRTTSAVLFGLPVRAVRRGPPARRPGAGASAGGFVPSPGRNPEVKFGTLPAGPAGGPLTGTAIKRPGRIRRRGIVFFSARLFADWIAARAGINAVKMRPKTAAPPMAYKISWRFKAPRPGLVTEPGIFLPAVYCRASDSSSSRAVNAAGLLLPLFARG
jgi:hypothetical protein